MPRNIPWLSGAFEKEGASRSKGSAKRAESRPHGRSGSDLDDGEETRLHQTAPPKKRVMRKERLHSRTPSTSPPPAPPPEEYMHPGYSADDIYRMVEDEFYTVAQQYTSHLHFAEYQRLKDQTRQKAFDTILSMRRPVDGKTKLSIEAKRKRDSTEQMKKTTNAVKSLASGEAIDSDGSVAPEEADDRWNGTSLHGLMLGDKRKPTALVGLEGVRSETRAAKGFRSPRKDRSAKPLFRSRARKDNSTGPSSEDGDSDDLAALPQSAPWRSVSEERDRARELASIEKDTARLNNIFSAAARRNSSNPPPGNNNGHTARPTTATPASDHAAKLPQYTSASSSHTKPSVHTTKSVRLSTTASSSSKPRRSALDLLDDFDDSDLTFHVQPRPEPSRRRSVHIREEEGQRSSERPISVKQEPDNKGKGKRRLDEVPLFL